MPAFRVMGRHEGFELRAYESFSVVSAPCEEASDIPLTPAAALRTTVTACTRPRRLPSSLRVAPSRVGVAWRPRAS